MPAYSCMNNAHGTPIGSTKISHITLKKLLHKYKIVASLKKIVASLKKIGCVTKTNFSDAVLFCIVKIKIVIMLFIHKLSLILDTDLKSLSSEL